jgi:hypothetical protein
LQNTPEAKYYIDEMSESNVGKYQLILTNADTYDREFSDTALIDIDTKPVITEEPNNNLEFKIGDTLHLKIKAESKSDLTYEWFKDDETLDYYEAEYTKEIINEEDEGRYNCFVMNNCDIVASNYVYVWVLSDVEDNNGNDIWFDIVPNPVCSNSILNIHSHDRRDCILSVVDILGQEIYNKKLIFMGDDIYRLNIFDIFENKNSGFYWITLKIDNILVSKPVLFVK